MAFWHQHQGFLRDHSLVPALATSLFGRITSTPQATLSEDNQPLGGLAGSPTKHEVEHAPTGLVRALR